MAEVQPITLDMHGLMQMGLMTQQLQEQQRHNAALEAHQSAQTEAFTQSHDTQSLLSIVNSKNIPIPTKYQALHSLMQINQQRNGMKPGSSPKIDPMEYTKNPALFDSLVTTVFAKGPQAPESQALLQQAMQSPDYPLFQDSVQQVMKEAQRTAAVKGWQQFGTQATKEPTSPEQGEALLGSNEAQRQVSQVVYQSPLEKAKTKQINTSIEDMQAKQGELERDQAELVRQANPMLVDKSALDSEMAYRQALRQGAKAGAAKSDNLAYEHGVMTQDERKQAADQLSTEIPQLRDQQRMLQQTLRQQRDSPMPVSPLTTSEINAKLRATSEAIRLKIAEKRYFENGSDMNFLNLHQAYSRYDELVQSGKDAITDIKRAQLGLRQGALDAQAHKFEAEQKATSDIGKAQQYVLKQYGYTPTADQLAEGAAKFGVRADEVAKGLKDPSKIGQVNVSVASPGERSDIAEGRTALRGVNEIENLYSDKFVGLYDNIVAKMKGPANLLTPDEAEFRAAVKKQAATLRKFYAGTAQSKAELKTLQDSIPDTDMSEVNFRAAINQTKKNIQRKLQESVSVGEEVGTKMPRSSPSSSQSLPPEKRQQFDELQRKFPGDSPEQIMEFLQKQGG